MSKNLVIIISTAIILIVFSTFFFFSRTPALEASSAKLVEIQSYQFSFEFNKNSANSSSPTKINNSIEFKDSHSKRVLNRGDITTELIPDNNLIRANLHPDAKTLEELINIRTLENRNNELNAVKSPFN